MALFKAKLETQNMSPKKTVEFMFNPEKFTIVKQNTWDFKPDKTTNVPQWQFVTGGARTISLDAVFDSYLTRQGVSASDVRTRTNTLFAMMGVDKNKKGANSKMSIPPKCRLTWGSDTSYHFDCYITSCTIEYQLFNQDGLPVRAKATLSLIEASDMSAQTGTNPTSRGEPGHKVWMVSEGDRLDWIAYQEYGDATQWRRIAEANRIIDPLEIEPGMVLSIPPL